MPDVRGLLSAGLLLLAGAGPAAAEVVLEVGPSPAPAGGGGPPVACWAVPGRTGAYRGYYVGGGTAFCGGPRLVQEGTWGWDYQGCLLLRLVRLRWSHGGRYQGGEGAYKTDGPPVPNVLAVPPPARHEGDH
jgi:hypothetical protein